MAVLESRVVNYTLSYSANFNIHVCTSSSTKKHTHIWESETHTVIKKGLRADAGDYILLFGAAVCI